ncbi:hypothetical protein Pla163_14140 [Planctomycetes bacterium Pla163]|uniref:Uncharacterized protein n=1 Tax=Rohdeia mirabilis TaxID=2528008 RepID=A0A518CYM5_9BACT|nr:hypothetical protein Pla163_14140 [Planctomycetes bacterium Pla163]
MAQWKLSRRHPACVVCEHVFEDGEQHFSRIEVGVETIERADVCRACWPKETEPGWIWWRARRAVARSKGLAVDWEILTQVFLALGPKLDALRAAVADGSYVAPEMAAPGTGVVEAADGAGSDGADSSGTDSSGADSTAAAATETETEPVTEAVEGEVAPAEDVEPAAEPEPVVFQDPVERLEQVRYLLALLLLRKRRLMLVRAVRRNDGEALVVRRPRRKDTIEVRAFELDPERMDALRGELVRLFEGEGFDEDGVSDDGGSDAGFEESGDEPEARSDDGARDGESDDDASDDASEGEAAPATEAAAKPGA